jgi:hypothetical protein
MCFSPAIATKQEKFESPQIVDLNVNMAHFYKIVGGEKI